jgi:hypothetical protein
MNKFLLFIAFIFAAVTGGYAQTNAIPELSIGGEFGFPTGQASAVYGTVLGGSVKLEVPVSKSNFHLAFTTGYSIFLTKFNYPGVYTSSLYVPVEAGARYYFSKIGYAEGDVGFSADLTGNYTPEKTAFIYSPIIGFSAPVYKHKSTVDIGFRYEGRVESGNSVGQIAIRIAYRFGI